MVPNSLRILYAEDDPDVRELVSLVLTYNNYEVVATDNEEVALSSARSSNFDLYLLDNNLYNSSGFELCKKLREFDTKTPILFYSGTAYAADRERAIINGAQGYLTKPVENQRLIKEVVRLISEAQHQAVA